MILNDISSEGDIMLPHFFDRGLRMNTDFYIQVLNNVVKLWIDQEAAEVLTSFNKTRREPTRRIPHKQE